MPELPEVETVARGLQRELAGRKILSITLGKTDFIDNPEALESELPGRTIARVERYGKFLLLRLGAAEGTNTSDGEAALLVHLGMTGLLMPKAVREPQAKHTHVVMLLDDGWELRYLDPRRFGRMAYLAGKCCPENCNGSAPIHWKWDSKNLRDEFKGVKPGSKRCCSTRAFCEAWEIFTRTRVYGRQRFIQRDWAGG